METVATKIPAKWKRVGLALGVDRAWIDSIEMQRRGDPLDCFSDVFHYWQQHATPKHPADWTFLIAVLRSQYIGEERLADFCQQNFA